MSLVLYLYRKYNSSTDKDNLELCKLKNVYCFCNYKIVGIDKNNYNKNQRLMLQQEYNMDPYYFTQDTFKNILLDLKDNGNFTLTSIYFLDESICESCEYEELNNSIINRKINEIYEDVNYILDEFDTEIYKISLKHLDTTITITSEGVLSLQSPMSIKKISNLDKVILGI
ncbi:hypothetical protein [Clostridium ihumii]|uniref:hypothetical protein n=1 Tax=Clostridium ihumii TaxID=1470356 RepID=UPI003D34372F